MNLLNTQFQMENLYIRQDNKTGLIGIIAIHNTKNGPALGGCRFVNYNSVDEAIMDAMKLAKAMTYKSAMAGLPLGGGKSVIISHPGIQDRQRVLEGFGNFVESLNGKYITASDSGTTEEDMHIVAKRTKYVTSINTSNEQIDDTAFMTATGVVKAIEAAVKCKLNKDHFNEVHIAVQGVGNVGYLITKMLINKGAKVTITDKNTKLLTQRAKEIDVDVVAPENITTVVCDVFSPCALGGTINQSTIENIQAPIICGAANNQLYDTQTGEKLHSKGILFVPDYVANAGGVICAASQANIITKDDAYQKVNNIYNSVVNIIEISSNENLPSYIIANNLAEKRIL